MKISNKIFLIISLYFIFSCAANDNFQAVEIQKNIQIEDLEKIPAYKRMGIEINNQKTQNEDILSKTILNEDNQLEFPDVNTYLHDNVD